MVQPPMTLRKRSFILLEILISLSLLAILLSFLFNAMAEQIKAEVRVSDARKILLARQQLQSRLQDLFLSITPAHFPPIYTKIFPNQKKASLILYFDNGIDPDPAFSGPILGRVYIDEENNLALGLWPLEKEKKNRPWRKEILLSHVTDFSFQFLGQKQKKEDKAITPTLAWHKFWPKKRMEIPSMLRLSIFQNDLQLDFAFFLTNAEPFVTYWEEGYQS